MRRRRRRQPTIPRAGDVVIDGRLRARLLGLHLLDIEAHIVVAPSRSAPTVSAVGRAGRALETEANRRVVVGPDAEPPPELAYAIRLIAEGSSLLDEASTG